MQRAAERGRLALQKLRQERMLAGLAAELKRAAQGNSPVPTGQHRIQRRFGKPSCACHDHSINCKLNGPSKVVSGTTAMRSNEEGQRLGMVSCGAAAHHSIRGLKAQLLNETAGVTVVQQDPVQCTAHVQWKLKRCRPQASEYAFSSSGLKEFYQRLWLGMNCLCTCTNDDIPRGACPVLPYTYTPHSEE